MLWAWLCALIPKSAAHRPREAKKESLRLHICMFMLRITKNQETITGEEPIIKTEKQQEETVTAPPTARTLPDFGSPASG